MKKFIFIFSLFSIIYVNVLAKSYDVTQLPIVVRNIPEWCNEYPTVINNWKGLFLIKSSGDLPPVLSVIIALDDIDTKGMTEDAFNEVLMSKDNCKMKYLTKKNGVNVVNECKIFYNKNIYWAGGITMNNPDVFSENVTMKNIKNASVFDFNTFSLKTGNLTNIDEMSILDVVGNTFAKLGFVKTDNKKKPDMILELSQGKDDFNGEMLTLKVYDGSRMRKGVERILWSIEIGDISGDVNRREKTIRNTLKKYCSNFPFDIPTYGQSINTLGIAFENEQSVLTGQTLMVLKNSDAYEKGLRSGDAIISAYLGYASTFYYTRTRRYYFKANRKKHQKNWRADLLFILPIIPTYTYNSETYLTDDYTGGNLSNLHFKVRNTFGEKFTIDAPFKTSLFNFKYIR